MGKVKIFLPSFIKKIRILPETGTGILSVLRRIIKRLDRFLKVRYNGDI